jgi:hypothetical protein
MTVVVMILCLSRNRRNDKGRSRYGQTSQQSCRCRHGNASKRVGSVLDISI